MPLQLLGQRIAFRHDEDADGDVDDEKWANVVHDERWRTIAVYHWPAPRNLVHQL